MAIARTPRSCFYDLHIHSQNANDSKLPSSLEIAFLSDSGASSSVLNKPAYMMITQMFTVCIQDHYETSKTLTIAN